MTVEKGFRKPQCLEDIVNKTSAWETFKKMALRLLENISICLYYLSNYWATDF